MTLLMTLRGNDHTIMLSDRRLSSNAKLVGDEFNKATIVTYEDAALACAFTGLAKYNGFSTDDWLLEALAKTAEPDFLSVPSLQRLRHHLAGEFQYNPELGNLAFKDKRLAILFSGFHYEKAQAFPVSAILTNFKGFAGHNDLPFIPDDFVLREVITAQRARVGFAGAWPAITTLEIQQLNQMLDANKPPKAVIEKAISIMHSAADRSAAANTIGGQISSIIIWADRKRAIETAYHVRNSSPIAYSPNAVFLSRSSKLVTKGGMVYQSRRNGAPLEPEKPLVVPKVHRNAPCPCGSKVRYRNCHGKRLFFSH